MIGKPAGKNSDPNDIWEINFSKIRDNINEKFGKELIDDLFEFYSDEIGLDKLSSYLEEQDRIESLNNYGFSNFGTFILKESNKIDYNTLEEEEKKEEEEEKFISKKEYNSEAIKSSLLKYFLNELVEDIPTNSILVSDEDAINFIKAYQIKFLYEIIIPSLEADNTN